jgi:hypothetical protein
MAPLQNNGLGVDHIENTAPLLLRAYSELLLRNGLHNPVVLWLHACMLRALHSNGRCLQRHCLVSCLYATILSVLI